MIHVPLLHPLVLQKWQVLAQWMVQEMGTNWADRGEEVWCGTCLGRLSPGLTGSRRAKDDAFGIQKEPSLCVCG